MGCGAIGSALSEAVQRPPLVRSFRLSGLHDLDRRKADALAGRLRPRVPVLPLALLIQRSDVVAEAASAAAAPTIVRQALRRGRTVLALSVGGLLPLRHQFSRWTRGGGRLLIPSGAIAGLDALKAARLGQLRRVTLTTRKPPRTLAEAPGAARYRARLAHLTSPLTLFHGSAARAVRAFPQNVNVAATLALAGLGPTRTRVRIVADPTVRQNIHELEAVGTSGRLLVRTENRPSARNPKTSELAILSAAAALQSLAQSWRVGT